MKIITPQEIMEVLDIDMNLISFKFAGFNQDKTIIYNPAKQKFKVIFKDNDFTETKSYKNMHDAIEYYNTNLQEN